MFETLYLTDISSEEIGPSEGSEVSEVEHMNMYGSMLSNKAGREKVGTLCWKR